jgi:hypothetical protein
VVSIRKSLILGFEKPDSCVPENDAYRPFTDMGAKTLGLESRKDGDLSTITVCFSTKGVSLLTQDVNGCPESITT